MPVLKSKVDPSSAEFAANARVMQQSVDEMRRLERVVLDKEQSAAPKFRKLGQLLPRERIELLLDRGTPFLELMSLAGYGMHDDSDGTMAGGGTIAGIGHVSGVRCLVGASNAAIKGGTIAPAGVEKSLRLHEIGLENKLPSISLTQSGGANLNYASEVFVPGGRSFANQARKSAAGIPQITVVHGSSTAGGAYQPGLSDYVVVVRKQAKMFLAGPPLLLAATGEVATEEELGGAELHACDVGTADYLAEDDADGLRLARQIMAQLPWPRCAPTTATFLPPRYSPDDLLGVVPSDPKVPYDVREILARIADDSEYADFKHEFDPHTVCGHIAIHGHRVGIIGNNGPITPQGAVKAAQFIQLCDQVGTPLLFIHNTTGFLVGTEAERGGIIKHGSKLIQAVANARVPKISVVVGGSYGAGNYAMCGRGFDPRFIFAWPNSRTAVMGPEQAGKVLRIVTEQRNKAMGVESDPQMLDGLEAMVRGKLEAESTAFYGTARLWDDGLIDPRDTRSVLAIVLGVCKDAEGLTLRPNTFGVARL